MGEPDTRAVLDRLSEHYWQTMVRDRAREIFHAGSHGKVVDLDAMRWAMTEARADICRRLAGED